MEESDQICRTCLKSSSLVVPLFKDPSLCQKIQTISSIVMSPRGNLPTVVCIECVVQINSAFKFRQLLINNYLTLKKGIIMNAILTHKRKSKVKVTRDVIALPFEENQKECIQSRSFSNCNRLQDLTSKRDAVASTYKGNRDELIPNPLFELRKIKSFNQLEDSTSKRDSFLTALSEECSRRLNNINIEFAEKHDSNVTVMETRSSLESRSLSCLVVNPDSTSQRSSPLVDHKASKEECCEPLTNTQTILNESPTDRKDPVDLKAAEEECGERSTNAQTILKESVIDTTSSPLVDHEMDEEECAEPLTNPETILAPIVNESIIDPDAKPSNNRIKNCLCQVCGKLFDTSNFSRHILVHQKLVVTCKLCGKPVRSLRHHMDMHNPPKRTCEHCGKAFKHLASYANHVNSHTGNRKFKCDTCDKTFFRKDSLTKHKRIHTGEKPYKCKYCQRRFTSGNILRTHIRQHTNEKPYTCDHCSKGFRQRVLLKNHLKAYTCDHCSKGFCQMVLLRNHMKAYHSELSSPRCT